MAAFIRPAINYRPGQSIGDPPPGAADADEVIEMIRKRKEHVKRYIRGWLKRVEL